MSKERKKVKKKPIPKVELKTRKVPKKRLEATKKLEPKPEPKPVKQKNPDKYVRIAADAPQEEFAAIGERVKNGELKWAYYAFDTTKGYHHYIVLPKQQQ